ncbi:MAG TPA: hypothetical protein VMN77_05460 [Nitrospiria bacterium]|jgi:hypothetical protein|nr:hypothetical protein [Nitrospiria bacterium]
MTPMTKTEGTETLNRSEATKAPGDEVYRYQDSGIAERHGKIPLWLTLVSIALLIWGVYYTIQYWSTD